MFDLDGTLHDKAASLQACAVDMHTRFTHSLARERFIARFVEENGVIQPKEEVFARLACAFDLPAGLAEQMRQDFDRSFARFCRGYPQAKPVLSGLKERGYRLGVVTNGRDSFQRSKIASLGIEPYFDVILTSGELGIKKPDPRIFRAALSALQAEPADTVFCGDSLEADMIPANALGMTTFWKTERVEPLPASVDLQFSHFSEFLPLIDKRPPP